MWQCSWCFHTFLLLIQFYTQSLWPWNYKQIFNVQQNILEKVHQETSTWRTLFTMNYLTFLKIQNVLLIVFRPIMYKTAKATHLDIPVFVAEKWLKGLKKKINLPHRMFQRALKRLVGKRICSLKIGRIILTKEMLTTLKFSPIVYVSS